jgi:uncharacterized membrane protein
MKKKLTFFAKVRKYLIAGLLVWVPVGITILVSKLLIDLLDRSMVLLPPPWRPENLLGFSLPGIGIIISAIIILTTGFIVTNMVGRRMVSLGESLLEKIPFVRSIYSAVKQVTETILSQDKNSFRQVLLIEYPRKGVWTVAFQTSESMDMLNDLTKQKLITVFIPTTPNPTSGFVLMIPKKDAIKLDIDVEDALKLIMSLGVVTPGKKADKIAELTENNPATKKTY